MNDDGVGDFAQFRHILLSLGQPQRPHATIDFKKFKDHLKKCDFESAKQMVNTQNATSRNDRLCGYGIISYVCEYGPDDPEFLCHFLEKGATLELDSDGIRSSPLHCAAATNKPRLIYKMLDLGIPVNIISKFYTPLDKSLGSVSYSTNELCAKILVDAGGVTKNLYTPSWLCEYKTKRNQVRESSIAVLGLLVCRSRVVVKSGNRRDVLRIIARCVWSTRAYEIKK